MDGYMFGKRKTDDPDDILIGVSSLAEYQEERTRQREQTFKKILLQCSRKIQNEFHMKKQTMCAFEIPEFVPGSPKFDKKECLDWLTRRLEEKGYDVEFAEPCHLVISWSREINKILEERRRSGPVASTSNSDFFKKKDKGPTVMRETAMIRTAQRAEKLRQMKRDHDKYNKK